jgi:membrane protease YdiL (CAAX protease family)
MGMQILWSVLYVILGGFVFVLGLNLLKLIPKEFKDIYKIGIPMIFLILFFVSQKYFSNQKNVLWAFFLVSVGWMLDFFLTERIANMLSLNSQDLSGMAYTMVISTLLVSAPVVIGWLLSGHQISTIYIQSSEKMWGIIIGITGLLLFGGLGVFQAQGQGIVFKIIGAAIPMALVFSLANAFREELVYRAIFLDSFRANIGVLAAIIVTTLVFVVAHIEVSYDPASLVIFLIILVLIGVVGSQIMIKTGSLIGAVLFHAGADVLLIMGLLSSQQLILR